MRVWVVKCPYLPERRCRHATEPDPENPGQPVQIRHPAGDFPGMNRSSLAIRWRSRKSGGGLRLVALKSPSGSARDGSSPCWKSQTGSGSTCWLAVP